MSNENQLIKYTLPAAGDLSAKQYRFLAVDTNGQVDAVATQGNDPVGVLCNKPDAAGKAAEIAVYGIAKVVAAGAINPGAKVMSNNAGAAIAATSTNFVAGQYLGTSAAASGDIIPVLLRSGGRFALS